jgi:pimeloyl-ACP methyl ester carboxylesterase
LKEIPRLVLFPGLGADLRLFSFQLDAFPSTMVPRWTSPRAGESLPAYAARMAGAIVASDKLFLGGSSFGGMVALEIARILRPAGTLLIGSCRSPKAIAPLWRLAGAVAGVLPGSLPRPPAAALRWALGPCPRGAAAIAEEMLADADPAFVSWGLEALLRWKGVCDDPGLRIHHIHGARDRLIPVHRCAPDHVVTGAGHLLALTHAGEVNTYIEERLRSPL